MKRETRSTCPYCGVGCGVIVESEDAQITGVRGDPDHPANFGRLCTKGSTLHLTATADVNRQTRLAQPLRRFERGGVPQPVGWDEALDHAADRFASVIAAHGPDAAGFYLSGQLLTEDYYVYNKLAKGLIGTNNIDTNSRLCMSSAVSGYKMTLGADAPPACYDDLRHVRTLFITGSNTAYAHPILYRRIEDAKAANPVLKTIVVDPRRTETALAADLHLAIQPGTDVALYHGMLHLMLWEGWADAAYIAAHTRGFDALRARVRDFTPKEVAKLCGIAESDLLQATRWFANLDPDAGSGASGAPSAGRLPTLSLYCQGLNQSADGAAKNAALINLHLATGQIGRPGTGPFSLTGQPNAMGGREVGGMANLLSGHRDMANPKHRAEVAALWGVDSVPEAHGKTAVELFEAVADGEIKVLWIACTNPAQSMPDQPAVRRALERAEFVVVQEAYSTPATCAYADLLLPATTWGEKDGTVTNSERCISRVRPAVPAYGASRHDWSIGIDFGRRLQQRLRVGRPSLFAYDSAESIWNEHRETTRGRDLDITGLDYARLETAPAQWPWPAGADAPKARLYEDGRFPTDDGRAAFADLPYRPVAEPRDARYPYALNTGRLRDQWHAMSRTGTAPRLFGQVAEPSIEINPQDMARLDLRSGDLVRVASRRGMLVIPAEASEQQLPTQVFIAMHWGEEYLSGSAAPPAASRLQAGRQAAVEPVGAGRPVEAPAARIPIAGVNALTQPAFDPISKQPELKHAAVRIEKAVLPWRLLAIAWMPADDVLAAREALRPLLREFDFATCVPFGRERTGLLFRAAAAAPVAGSVVERIEQRLRLDGGQALHYADARRGQRRTMRLVGTGDAMRLDGFLLAGDISAEAWVRPLLQDELPAQAYGRLLLVPGAKAPVAFAARGRQVCSCFDVSETQIEAQLATAAGPPEAQLARLQAELRCGTNCGSCLPELRRMVKSHQPVAAPG